MKEQPTILKQWQSYEKYVLPKRASRVQIQETRRAFYAGVTALMGILQELGGDEWSEEEQEESLDKIHQECRDFVDRVGVDY